MGILDRFKLDGKAALVTGAGSGIGRGYALALADAGADVAVVDIDKANADKVAGEVKAKGRRAISIVADVTRKEGVDSMIGTVLKEFGKLDIAVNNVGGRGRGGQTPGGDIAPSLRHTEQNMDGTYELTIKANFMCARAEALQMMKQKKGKIIFTASISGTPGTVGGSIAYCTMKAGVIQMTKIFANELGEYGINVNSISPGVIQTRLTQRSLEDGVERKHLIDRTPMGWIGQPEDLQGAVVFLASEASDWMTGENLIVDGGFTLVPIHH